MTENGDVRCESKGRFRYTWPGKDETVVCEGHASGIQAVANAIGCHLQMIPLSEMDPGFYLPCSSIVGKE